MYWITPERSAIVLFSFTDADLNLYNGSSTTTPDPLTSNSGSPPEPLGWEAFSDTTSNPPPTLYPPPPCSVTIGDHYYATWGDGEEVKESNMADTDTSTPVLIVRNDPNCYYNLSYVTYEMGKILISCVLSFVIYCIGFISISRFMHNISHMHRITVIVIIRNNHSHLIHLHTNCWTILLTLIIFPADTQIIHLTSTTGNISAPSDPSGFLNYRPNTRYLYLLDTTLLDPSLPSNVKVDFHLHHLDLGGPSTLLNAPFHPKNYSSGDFFLIGTGEMSFYLYTYPFLFVYGH